jgi:hypothetical protein
MFLVMALAAAGCGVLSLEEQLLTDFFEASRLHDTTIVARFSTVTFSPRENGVVRQFEVERVADAADGQSKVVTVQAQVRDFSGTTSSRRLTITLRRHEARWLITDIR